MKQASFQDINDLVAAVQVDDIVVHEERARRIVWPDVEDFELPEPSLALGFRKDGNSLRYRFRVVVAAEQAEYVADFEGVYSVPDVDEVLLDQSLIQEFAGRVALMAVYPFIRVSIFAGAGRLGLDRPVMSIIKQGDFQPGATMSEDDVRATFGDTQSELA